MLPVRAGDPAQSGEYVCKLHQVTGALRRTLLSCCSAASDLTSAPAVLAQVDITEGVQKQCTVLWCKECNRWLQARVRSAAVLQ